MMPRWNGLSKRGGAQPLRSIVRVTYNTRDERDIEIINQRATRLNEEALDVLKYQVIPPSYDHH